MSSSRVNLWSNPDRLINDLGTKSSSVLMQSADNSNSGGIIKIEEAYWGVIQEEVEWSKRNV